MTGTRLVLSTSDDPVMNLRLPDIVSQARSTGTNHANRGWIGDSDI